MGYKKTANFSLLLLRGQVSTMMSSQLGLKFFLRRFIISEKTYDLQCIRILFGLINFNTKTTKSCKRKIFLKIFLTFGPEFFFRTIEKEMSTLKAIGY